MPDFNPSQVAGEGAIRRPTRANVPRFGAGGLPTEGIDPSPRPWPFAPWLALLVIVAFLALQFLPATHVRHPADPSRTWQEIVRKEDGSVDVEAMRRKFNPSYAEQQNLLDFFEIVNQQNASEASDADLEALERIQEHEVLRKRKSQFVHIFLSTDEADLRPLAVVINSTLINARHPEKIKFHLVIPTTESQVEYYKLTSFFEHTSIEILRDGFDLQEISKRVKYRKDSKAREDLTSPYNFLPFYLPRMLKDKDIDKFIYLDTDVVVKYKWTKCGEFFAYMDVMTAKKSIVLDDGSAKPAEGDLEELYNMGLEGFPAAAAKDCSQRFRIYFDFKQLADILSKEGSSKPFLPKDMFDEEACIFNRGTLVIDVKEWIQRNITEAIEWWMNEYDHSDKPLYKYGLSQPPFLLALYKNYKELDHAWNVRGLGRDEFSKLEQDFMEETYRHRPQKKPFISMESDYAKVLHFNGKFKPWKRDRVRLPAESIVSLCGAEGQECYKLWWQYLSPRANEAFKPSTKNP